MSDFLEYLNKQYGGGGNATPSTETTSSTDFASYLNKQYGSQVAKASQSTPTTAQNTRESILEQYTGISATPSTKSPTEAYNDKVISDYESLGGNFFTDNALTRYFSQSARDRYNKKQELFPEYQRVKNEQTASLIEQKGIPMSDLQLATQTGMSSGMAANYQNQLKKKYGLSDSQIKDALEYARTYNKEQAEQLVGDYAKDHEVGASILSLATNPVEGMADSTTALAQYLTGTPIADRTANLTNNIRSSVSEEIQNNAKTKLGATLGNFAYQGGMALGDELVSLALGKASGVSKLAGITQGIEKAGNVVNSAIERGLSPDKIISEGIVSGAVTTYLTDKALDGIIKGSDVIPAKQIGKYIGTQMAKEGLEEGAEDVADLVTDLVIGWDKNELKTTRDALVRSGMSSKEAWKKVATDKLTETLSDIVVGGLTGGVMAGGSVGIRNGANYLNNLGTDVNFSGNFTDGQNTTDKDYYQQKIARDYNNMVAEENAKAEANRNARFEEESNANTVPDLGALLEQAKNEPSKLTPEELINKYYQDRESGKLDNFTLDAPTNENVSTEEMQSAIDNYRNNVQISDLPFMSFSRESQRAIENGGFPQFTNNINQTADVKTELEKNTELSQAENETNAENLTLAEDIGIRNSGSDNETFVDYKDKAKQNTLLEKTREKAIAEGKEVSITSETLGEVSKIFPDLRSVKKSERTPLLKEAKAKAFSIMEKLLKQRLGDVDITFDKNGEQIIVRLYNEGINHSVRGINDAKAAAFYQIEELIDNATYMYSTNNDVHGSASNNENIVGWDYYYTPFKIPTPNGVMSYGIKFAVKDLGLTPKSLYDMKLKKAPFSLDNPQLSKVIGASSSAFFDESISPLSQESNIDKGNISQSGNIPTIMAEDIGLGRATETTKADGSEVLTEQIPYLQERADGQYVSQTASNSVYNGIASRDEQTRKHTAEKLLDDSMLVTRVSEKESLAKAQADYNADPEGIKKAIMTTEELDGVRTDEAMIILEEERQKALETGDYTEFDKWMRVVADRMHKVGQALQALAKYTRTATGTMLTTQKLRDANIESFKKKASNKPKIEKSGKLAQALTLMGNDGSMVTENTQPTHEEMVQRVKNTLDTEYASVFEDFEEADYEYLANLIENNYSSTELSEALQDRLANGDWGFSEEEVNRINELFDLANKEGINSRKASEYLDEAYRIAAEHIGKRSFMGYWNSWRYFAMLGNPRTHFRNILGNAMFGGVTNIKDVVLTAVEGAYKLKHPEYQRTAAIVSKATDPELFNSADADFEKNGFGLVADDGHKYSMKSKVEGSRKDLKPIEINNNLLEKEDNYAIKKKYVRSLAEYLKSNGKTGDVLTSTDEADIEFSKKARERAVKEAKEATFHEENKFASWLNRMSGDARRTGGVTGFLTEAIVESVMPFKKTPANIVKQGIEYSPIGFVKSAYEIGTKQDAEIWLNSLAKSLTGSGIMALGMALASAGILRGSNDDEDDKALGDQEYSINVGNFSYTIDWAAPAALPLFVGVETYKAINGDNTLIDAITSIAEPVTELSMLQGIRSTLQSLSYGMQNNPTQFAANSALTFGTGYLTQGIPTVLGQVARSVDDTRRSTYSDQTGILGSFDYQAEKVINKIPGLSMTNEAYIDAFGNEQKNVGGNVLGRLAYNMISPGYYSNTERTPLEAELERLGDKNGKSYIPASPDKNYNNKRIDEKTYEQLSRDTGRLSTEGVNSVMKSANYKALNDTDRGAVIDDIEAFCKNLAKVKNLGYQLSSSDNKAYEIYKEKGMQGVADYFATRQAIKSKTTSSKQSEVIPALSSLPMSDTDKGRYLADYFNVPEKAQKFVDEGDYENLYNYYKFKTDADTDGDGLDRTELATYLRQIPSLSLQDKVEWFKTFYPTGDIPTLY